MNNKRPSLADERRFRHPHQPRPTLQGLQSTEINLLSHEVRLYLALGPLIRKQSGLYALGWQPAITRDEPPRDDSEDRHDAHDHRCVVEVLAGDRELVGGEEDGHHPAVPQDGDGVERLAPPAQAPRRLGEVLGRQEEPAEGDEPVGGCRGHAGCRDQGREGHGRREDGAGDEGRDPPDDQDGVPGLSVLDLGDPAGEGQDAISRHGEHETGRGKDGNGGVLFFWCG